MEVKDFFNVIFGEQEGLVVLALPNAQGAPTNNFWFEYPEQEPEMREFVKENWSLGVFFSPIIFKEKKHSKENALTTQVISVDADKADPGTFKLIPSIVLESSPDRWHLYYLLDKPQQAHEVAKRARVINRTHLEEGCDPNFQNAGKLMRVPGTMNNKYYGAHVKMWLGDEDIRFTLDDIEKEYPLDSVEEQFLTDKKLDMPDGIELMVEDRKTYYDLMDKIFTNTPLGESIVELLQKKPAKTKRSETLYKLLCDLFRYGFTPEEVATMAWQSPASEKWKEDPRGLRGLWEYDLTRAYAEVNYEISDLDMEGIEVKEDPLKELDRKVSQKEEVKFLLPEDEPHLFQNTIDRWQAWGEMKTDAIPEYHRTACLMIMSTLYSDYGKAHPGFDPLSLNLYQMVLGRTTKDRKTTAMNYGLKMLDAVSEEPGQYRLGGDVSPTGINAYMSENPNKSKIFDRDEVQDYFEEIFNQQWTSGILGMFNGLYEGKTNGRIRANSDMNITPTVDAIFSMYLNGIFTQTAATLTIDNFFSGFLMRFLYTVEERPPGWVEPPLEQGGKRNSQADAEWAKLAQHFTENRKVWAFRKRANKGKHVEVLCAPDAWDRYLKFRDQTKEAVKGRRNADLMEALVDRLSTNVLKVITLLAMDDKSTTAEMRHVVYGIKMAENWFASAMMVANQISGSEWERELDEMEDIILENGGSMTYSSLYKRFKGKRPMEFEEMIRALAYSGRIMRQQAGKSEVLRIDDEG